MLFFIYTLFMNTLFVFMKKNVVLFYKNKIKLFLNVALIFFS